MPTLRVQLPQTLSSSSDARRYLASFLRPLGRADLTPDASLVVAELVTNAVVHGAQPIRLSFDMRAQFRIEVFDGDQRAERVVPRRLEPDAPGGHGLRLVDALADDWGAIARPDGKTVWAELHIPHLG
jgi:anti-sigma regulatory factor (Ser/Thr protein kinase)